VERRSRRPVGHKAREGLYSLFLLLVTYDSSVGDPPVYVDWIEHCLAAVCDAAQLLGG